MTDSEDDVLSSNVYSLPNDRTTIHAKGPNISTFSSRNNFFTSTMHSSRNLERRNLNYDQRSLYSIRDTSPLSLRSVPDFRPRNFHHPYSMGGASYQRSVFNGRSGSPTSVRSIDTNVSMSATDIALAIKNEAYNKHDLKLIKEALNKQFKRKLRRRVEKRRNQRLLLHMSMSKRKSDDDSGEQGSDSSISSEDCRSIRTAPCMTNNPRYKTKFNLTNMKVTANEGNMYNDCTEDIRRKSLRNIICPQVPPAPIQNSIKSRKVMHPSIENGGLLQDRFKSAFLLPSQRFNQSVTEPLSSNLSRLNPNNVHSNQIMNANQQLNNNEISKNTMSDDIESEQEEIFSEITTIERNSQIVNNSHKRTIDPDELHYNPQKKNKVSNTQIIKSSNEVNYVQNDLESDFIFVKPQMPVRKSSNTKKKLHSPEKLISKSRQPLFDTVEHPNSILSSVKEVLVQKSSNVTNGIEIIEKENNDKECVKPARLSDDLSMQPSFLKRKLFTQKLDMAEKKNISDSSLSSSPHIKNNNSNKEKTKARKLASSQSCLSRDVLEEDNNFLDLIHKIVPADQINVSNATNKNTCNRNSQRDSNDKWDITFAISTCYDKDISDTYTDEEIFKFDNHSNNKTKCPTNTKTQSKLTSNCKVVLEKLPVVQQTKIVSNIAPKRTTVKKAKECNKENTNIIKSFWDTDTESELENYESSHNLNDSQNNNKVDKSINKDTNCKKLQNPCTPEEAAKIIRVRNKSQRGTNIKNATSAGINKSTKNGKRNINTFLELKENNNNLLNMSFSSDGNTQKTNKPTETSKTVMLISHRMGRSKKQVKPKKLNTIEFSSPKDTDISVKEKEKPTETSKANAIITHRRGRSKSQVKSHVINPVESPLVKDTNYSDSEFNISSKSLRSYNKNNKVNEKVVARNLKSRNRSGVKGV